MALEGGDGRAGFLEHRSTSGQNTRMNGFSTVPEPKALSCRADLVAPFSLPTEALLFEPAPELVVSQFENGDRERKIHCNVELQANELDKLLALQKEAASQGLKFFPSVTAMATRFLSHARMDVKKALRCMQATHEWRKNYFAEGPLADESVCDDLRHGIVYFSGRDRDLRPVLVVRGRRIPHVWYKEKRVDKLIRLLVFCMEFKLRFMSVPGRVENLSVVVDLKGVSLAQVSLSALSEVYKVMSYHYSGRVFRFYVAHMPYALGMIAGMVKSLLTDRQKQKLVVLKDVKELRKVFALHQLEEDLGGSRPLIEQFYPFPLPAGPFDAGNAAGPDAAATPDAHLLLTDESVIGNLWDPQRNFEENTNLLRGPLEFAVLERLSPAEPPAKRRPAASDSPPHSTVSTEELLVDAERLGRRLSSSSCSSTGKDWHQDVQRCKTGSEPSTEEGTTLPLDPVELEQDNNDAWEGLPEERNENNAIAFGGGVRFACGACCHSRQRVASPKRIVSL